MAVPTPSFTRLLDIPEIQMDAGFSTLLFGDPKPYQAAHVDAKVMCFRPPEGDTLVTLSVIVAERFFRLPHGRLYSRRTAQFKYRFQVRDILRIKGRGEAFYQHLADRMQEGVRALHHLVREHDPRLGDTSAALAPFPLFDPPGGIPEHGGLCALCNHRWCITSPAKPDSECGRDTLMWAGANLTWVHPWCWDELHP